MRTEIFYQGTLNRHCCNSSLSFILTAYTNIWGITETSCICCRVKYSRGSTACGKIFCSGLTQICSTNENDHSMFRQYFDEWINEIYETLLRTLQNDVLILFCFYWMATLFCVQRKVGYPHNYLQCRGWTINFINFYFVLLFQAKAIALAAKNGKDVCVCVFESYSEYLQIIKTLLTSCLRCAVRYFNISHCQYLFRWK